MMKIFSRKTKPFAPRGLWMMVGFLALGLMGASGIGTGGTGEGGDNWHPFSLFSSDSNFTTFEKIALVVNLCVALSGLFYAKILANYVNSQPNGTPVMQEIAKAVREGANAYLSRQFKVIIWLILILAVVLTVTKWPWHEPDNNTEKQIAIGRGIAFLMGSIFSAMVGYFGMSMATIGNLKVATAARSRENGFGMALQIGYRSGTVTGMLTDGLGLLGGTLIFLYYGEKAFEVLLGFGFGGTLLALFMRVGGGIYTKAADVGADLVGKIEAGIPEDDPRNAATIADNVGDNVGDCAGMAADIFESYEVTIVAALILGLASFGHMGVIFPLLVHAIGVIGSIISTSQVKAEKSQGVKAAMAAVTNGFWLGALISVIAICGLGALYLRPTPEYLIGESIKRGLYTEPSFVESLTKANAGSTLVPLVIKSRDELKKLDQVARDNYSVARDKYVADLTLIWKKSTPDSQAKIASEDLVKVAQNYMPLYVGFDYRPILTCLIGIALALALHWCTDYWTSTEHDPVKQLAKSCRTGHATNIISGIALGYESAVWSVLIISVALLGSVLVYSGTNPIFIAYGVAMCGIGMLTLTGNIISMDVFGPIADNANGIGEMGYNRDQNNQPLPPEDPNYMNEEDYKIARQTLADLDAVGNTTKAITKGIAIGSAVLAAVSLFASFIAVVATGKGEDAITTLSAAEFAEGAAKLNLADSYVFIGMLLGGAVPFLFSSMTIRAVGRAAFLIVQECRAQFRDKEIWAGTKRPNYGRVVDICTSTAQKELVGPGLLAIFAPVVVGFAMGPYALGGFLAGMILIGQMLAVFMANAGGAWDNAKKTIEDQPKTSTSGKGSEAHKASVTGDTVGDPLKDTAGPAINPLIKVMNMVSLLILPLVMNYNLKDGNIVDQRYTIGLAILGVGLIAVAWAWWQSNKESDEMKAIDEELSRVVAGE